MASCRDGTGAFRAGGLYSRRGRQAAIPARNGLAEATPSASTAARAIATAGRAANGRAAIRAEPAAQFLQLGGGRAAILCRLRRHRSRKQKAQDQKARSQEGSRATHHGR